MTKMGLDRKAEAIQKLYDIPSSPMLTKDFIDGMLATGFCEHFNPEINSTIPYYPMLMYTFAYCQQLQYILEVGTLKGYTSYYLAKIAALNGGHYYGIDIDQSFCDYVGENLTKCNLPNTMICADTKTLTEIPIATRIDMAFLDGEHTTKAVLHEVELIYPLMPGNGSSFIFIHDIIDQGNSDAWWKLKNDKRFEALGMNANYGLGIIRKMEGMDCEELARKFGKLE